MPIISNLGCFVLKLLYPYLYLCTWVFLNWENIIFSYCDCRFIFTFLSDFMYFKPMVKFHISYIKFIFHIYHIVCHMKHLTTCACVLSHYTHVRLFVTLWTVARRLLCPWDLVGKNTGVGCHFLLQGIFPRSRDQICISYVSFIGRWVVCL